jgi:hypothetical protein
LRCIAFFSVYDFPLSKIYITPKLLHPEKTTEISILRQSRGFTLRKLSVPSSRPYDVVNTPRPPSHPWRLS